MFKVARGQAKFKIKTNKIIIVFQQVNYTKCTKHGMKHVIQNKKSGKSVPKNELETTKLFQDKKWKVETLIDGMTGQINILDVRKGKEFVQLVYKVHM